MRRRLSIRFSGREQRLFWLVTVSTLAAVGAPHPVLAQSAGASLEEVVVTARRRSETLMQVPVADSVISGQAITRYNLTDLSGVAKQVPSVSLERTSNSTGASLTIRGIGSADTDSAVEQSVSVVLDGMQVSKGFVVQQGLFDMSQVEVLEGPQALFFGKNVSAGVVALHSNDPGDHLAAYIKGGYEFEAHEKTLEGAISAPLSDTLAARLAFRGSDMRGWMRNDARPTANPFFPSDPLPGAVKAYNPDKSLFGRLTLVWRPSANFKATLKAYGGAEKDYGWGQANEIGNCGRPPFASYVVGGATFQDPYSDCTLNGRLSAGGLPQREAAGNPIWRDGSPFGEYQSSVTSLALDYDAGAWDVTAITGYHWFHEEVEVNSANTVYPYGGYIWADYTFAQFSQEVRAVSKLQGPLNYTLGVYFDADRLDHDEAIIISPLPADPATGRFDTLQRLAVPKGKTYSVFGQVRWAVTPQLELAAGARWSHDEKSGFLANTFVHPTIARLLPTLLAPAGRAFQDSAKFDNVSPEVTLTWRPNADLMTYAAFKTGYKSGGFAAQSLVTPLAAPPGSVPGVTTFGFKYNPEKVKGAEVGAKAQLLDRRLRVTGTIFRYDYTDLQLSNFSAAPVPTFQILNAGKLRTQGVEAEALWRATDELTLHAAAAYTRARYINFTGIDCYSGETALAGCQTYASGPLRGNRFQDLSGRTPPKAPDWTANAGFTFDHPLAHGLILGLTTDLRYSGRYLLQQNLSPFAVQKAYTVVDASISLSSADDKWRIALIGRNLGDEHYAISSVDKPAGAVGATGEDISEWVARPRQIELVVTLKY